jgi:hypothetical protein
MRTAGFWFLVAVGVCVVGPYVLGVRPRSARDWTLIAITIAFMAWMLPLMVPLRSG